MKKSVVLSLFMLFTAVAFGQNNKMDSWAELKDFHTVMSQTFHPSEDGNLQPIKQRAEELLNKAVALYNSKAPAELDTPQMKETLMKLATDCKLLLGMVVEKKSDEEITKKLSEAHDSFHAVAGMCQAADKNSKHE